MFRAIIKSFGKGTCVFVGVAAVMLMVLSVSPSADARSRIKDIADFEGVRENLLIGYGLVVGLNGTGDSLNNSVFTQQSLVSMLERLGVNTRGANIQTDNVAAVIVTATLPAFARHGSHIDVTVSALGDANNLQGGTLLVTPLLGADGEVYAVSQGQLAVAGFSAEGQSGTNITKGVPTSGRISNGAIVEREIDFTLTDLRQIKIALRNPDFTTARRVANAINERLGSRFAVPTDSGTIELRVPNAYAQRVADLLTDVEQLEVQPDTVARVVIDEASGVIVIGENVHIDTVAIAHGNLTIRISETPQVSQPGAFAPEGAQTVVVDRTEIEIDEDSEKRLSVVGSGVSLQDLVLGLNSLGVGPRDLMAILQTIKAAGALQAEIKVL